MKLVYSHSELEDVVITQLARDITLAIQHEAQTRNIQAIIQLGLEECLLTYINNQKANE